MALNEWEKDICPGGCGQPRRDSMDPRHDSADPEHIATYRTGAPWECLACRALHKSQREANRQFPEESSSYQWAVELVPRRRGSIPSIQ